MNQECSIELNSSIAQQRRAFLRDYDNSHNQISNDSMLRNHMHGSEEETKESRLDRSNIPNSLTQLEDNTIEGMVASNSSLYGVYGNEALATNTHVRSMPSLSNPTGSSNRLGQDRQNPPAGNAVQAQNNAVVQVQPDPTVPNSTWPMYTEAKGLLRRVSEIYVALMGMYILGILILKEGISFYFIFGFAIAICSLQLIRALRTHNIPSMTSRQKKAKYFKAVDWAALSAYLILAALRVEVTKMPLSPLVVPGFINAIFFMTFGDVHNSLIKTRTVALYKLLFWTQILMVSLRVDNVIDNWAFVFVALFYTLVFFMSVSVGFFILAFSYVCQSCHTDGFDYNIVGLIWDFLNALFSWVWGFSLLGLIEYLRSDDGSSILVPGLYVGIVHCGAIMLFTVLLRKNLLAYLTSTLQLVVGVEETEVVGHSFETIKKTIPYLLKISPTYFMVINDDFRMKDKKHTEGCKEQIKQVKLQRRYSKHIPKRLDVVAGAKKTVPEHKSATMTLQSTGGGITSPDTTPVETKASSLCYSDDDAEVLDQVRQKAEKNQNNEENEQSCMICCMNAPNAVFMKCGHGGVCYSCALETWKNGDKCALCRQPIDEILKVTLVNGVNVAKVIEGTKKYPTLTSLDDISD